MLTFFVVVNIFFILPIFLFGALISIINKKVVKVLRDQNKYWVYVISGFIGVPVHELSHAFFHVLFLNKIKKIVLYQPIKVKEDGYLGYVSFNYKEESLYQNLGLFFGGIAPMIGGSFVLFLLMRIFLPEAFFGMQTLNFESVNIWEILIGLKTIIINNVQNIIECMKTEKIQNVLIFIILTFSVSVSMDISPGDLKNAVKGGILLECVLIIVSILLKLFGLTSLITLCINGFLYMISFLTIALILSLISFLLAYVLKVIPT